MFLSASICLSIYISVEDSGFQVKEVTCLSFYVLFCRLQIVENVSESSEWGEEARFILFNICSREI